MPALLSNFHIRDGDVYKRHRNGQDVYTFSHKMSDLKLTRQDKKYLTWATSYRNKIHIYFSNIEDDFRLLNKPYQTQVLSCQY